MDKLKDLVQKLRKSQSANNDKQTKKQRFNTIFGVAIKRRKNKREFWLSDSEDAEKYFKYEIKQKEGNNILWCEKRNYMQNKMSEVEKDYQKQKSTYFYKKHELRYILDRDKK